MSTRFANNTAGCAAACLLLGASAAGFAQGPDAAKGYPSRPIRIVVPFTPGGQPDIVARVMAPRLVEAMGQPVIVDNRPGAGGTIGGRIVAGANPDGYTLMSVSAAHVVAPAVRANIGYDTLKDFAGVTMTANAAYYLVVPPSLEVRTVKDLIALAKARPGQLNFTSAGTGSATHFGGEMFKHSAGIDIVHVPHKGIPEALTDIMAGRVQIFMAPFGSTAGLIRDRRLRALAVSTRERSPALPGVPTAIEAGFKDYEAIGWFGLMAPAGTPPAIVEQLSAEVARAMATPALRERTLEQGATPVGSKPVEFERFVRDELAKWTRIIHEAGIKLD